MSRYRTKGRADRVGRTSVRFDPVIPSMAHKSENSRRPPFDGNDGSSTRRGLAASYGFGSRKQIQPRKVLKAR